MVKQTVSWARHCFQTSTGYPEPSRTAATALLSSSPSLLSASSQLHHQSPENLLLVTTGLAKPTWLCMQDNQGSYASHQRIHQHKSPYTCPECGAICRSAHVQTHITKNCLHCTWRVGFRCVHCNAVYSDVALLKSHIQGSHCEVFYKCPICPMAFKSAPSTHSHAYTQHPGIKIGEPK